MLDVELALRLLGRAPDRAERKRAEPQPPEPLPTTPDEWLARARAVDKAKTREPPPEPPPRERSFGEAFAELVDRGHIPNLIGIVGPRWR
ncbi:MAG: hypothetical protein H0T89_05900 [Deltaproteobacteria bacterium]|nr:hypothetical protein [Deltaproteobacteria bacterium]